MYFIIMFITISKHGEISQNNNTKQYSQSNLYIACNYRNSNNFEKLCCWNNEYELYGKRVGKAGTENTYMFPSPVDTELFFGTLCIIKTKDGEIQPLTTPEWLTFYNKQMGGYEDINEEQLSVESEYSDEEYTDTGYIKDGFVVDDKELTVEDYEEE
jgi:hypothetical protein